MDAKRTERGTEARSCALLAGREAAGRQGTGEAAPRLAGRRCRPCKGTGMSRLKVHAGLDVYCDHCGGTGERSSQRERSGPANKGASGPSPAAGDGYAGRNGSEVSP